MTPRRAAALAVIAASLAAGCLGSPTGPADEGNGTSAPPENASAPMALTAFPTAGGNETRPPVVHGPSSGTEFLDPRTLDDEQAAREPSIALGPEGAIYVTGQSAARASGEQIVPSPTASGVLWSPDGETFQPVPSPADAHQRQPGLEGDIAVDAEGRLYFVDTYVADNTLSRWTDGEEGPSWDFSRPVQETAGGDDRPWLTAHGDGIVYYVGNNGEGVPGPGNAQRNENGSRIWFYASEDGGRTFEQRRAFSSSQFCVPQASPVDDTVVLVVCSHYRGVHTPSNPSLPEPPAAIEGYETRVHVSDDRGRSWTAIYLRSYEGAFARFFPGAAIDDGGTPYAAWGEKNGTEPTRLYAARQTGDAWETMNVTPFEGAFQRIWLAAGSDGSTALVFYGTDDADPGQGSRWHAYLLATDDARAAEPVWELSRISRGPVAIGPQAPGDFFQNAYGPTGRIHVAYGTAGDEVKALYTRSLTAPGTPTVTAGS